MVGLGKREQRRRTLLLLARNFWHLMLDGYAPRAMRGQPRNFKNCFAGLAQLSMTSEPNTKGSRAEERE